MKRVLIVGSAGQDGRLLASSLREKGCEVSGVARGDVELGDRGAVAALIRKLVPAEIYYLAAHHHSRRRMQATTWCFSRKVSPCMLQD